MSSNSKPTCSPFSATFDSFDFAKQQSLDFFTSHSPSDILAPHPDLFESELDSSLAAFDELQLQLLTVDSNDAYTFLRSDTPTCGPPSTLTASSESAYDSLSSHSDSFYNYPHSSYTPSDYSFPLDLDMDFQRISVADYAAAAAAVNPTSSNPVIMPATVDPATFGTLPPTPPHSPRINGTKPFENRSSFSDYGPSSSTRIAISSPSDYYSQLSYNAEAMVQATVAPSRISASQLSVMPPVPLPRPTNDDTYKGDPRKKYQCTICPRAFARAYNLKTHMATHDPHRLKPHVCPHHTCGRSFSRKHDLGRHLVSIHRDDQLPSTHPSNAAKKSIGVDKGPRGWCERCGRGWVGKERDCDCHVK